MTKGHTFFALAILMALVFILTAPVVVYAADEVPPTPEPGGRITAPGITGVNPDPEPEEGQLSEIDASGSVQQKSVGVLVSSEAPPLMDIAPQTGTANPVLGYSLGVPMRYQESVDVSCGVQALGMAMDFLELGTEQDAPTSEELLSDLSAEGLLQEWGTGVEELAYIARQQGYAGSYSFRDWTLAQLQEQLSQGKPVVVSLGVNGENEPGHFVTVTGVSDDGQWVSYNDPALGKVTVPVSEFLVEWSRQGYAGMVTQREALAAEADPMLPVMGMFSALSALTVIASQQPWRRDVVAKVTAMQDVLADPERLGIGGRRRRRRRPRRRRRRPRRRVRSRPKPRRNRAAAQRRAAAAARRRSAARAAAQRRAAARRRAQEAARRRAREAARRRAAAEAQRREQARRQAALLKARREAEAKRRAAEAEAKRMAALAAKNKAEQEARRKAALEAQRKEQMERQAALLKARREAAAREARLEAEKEAALRRGRERLLAEQKAAAVAKQAEKDRTAALRQQQQAAAAVRFSKLTRNSNAAFNVASGNVPAMEYDACSWQGSRQSTLISKPQSKKTEVPLHLLKYLRPEAWLASQGKYDKIKPPSAATMAKIEDQNRINNNGSNVPSTNPTMGWNPAVAEQTAQLQDEYRERLQAALIAGTNPTQGFNPLAAVINEQNRRNDELKSAANTNENTPEVPVPSIWSNPGGWFQAKLINAGRQNEEVRERLVNASSLSEKSELLNG